MRTSRPAGAGSQEAAWLWLGPASSSSQGTGSRFTTVPRGPPLSMTDHHPPELVAHVHVHTHCCVLTQVLPPPGVQRCETVQSGFSVAAAAHHVQFRTPRVTRCLHRKPTGSEKEPRGVAACTWGGLSLGPGRPCALGPVPSLLSPPRLLQPQSPRNLHGGREDKFSHPSGS